MSENTRLLDLRIPKLQEDQVLTNKSPFRRSLQLGRENTIYAVLVDRQGNVHWSASGDYTPADGDSLKVALAAQ